MIHFQDQNDIVACLQGAVGIVRATSYESLCLWRRYGEDKTKHKWEGIGWGQMVTVGYIDDNRDRPVCVSVMGFQLDGQLVVQLEATSRWVDYTMVDQWARKAFPNITSLEDIDAMNFHIIVHKIARINEEKALAA